jgi:hypothetical protein
MEYGFVTVPGRAWEPKPRRAIIKNRSDIAVFYFYYRSRGALTYPALEVSQAH